MIGLSSFRASASRLLVVLGGIWGSTGSQGPSRGRHRREHREREHAGQRQQAATNNSSPATWMVAAPMPKLVISVAHPRRWTDACSGGATASAGGRGVLNTEVMRRGWQAPAAGSIV
jgi:hypothetical protein